MSDSIADLLAGRNMAEPPEIKAIQKFVHDRYQVTPKIAVSEQQIVIGVPSAGLAGALRPLLPQIKEVCQTNKRLVIRIQ